MVRTGGRFARQLLQLTADKLERGERDTRRLPDRQTTPDQSAATVQSPELPLLASSIREGVEQTRRTIDELRPDPLPANPLAAKRTFESARLQQARRRLEDLQRDEIPEAIAANDDP
jgi:hypothetical protein